MRSQSVAQYGATQYASQQAAPQVPAVPPVRPQQAALPSTHSTATFSRPLTQARPAATPAAAPAFGRPIVQAPAGSRVTASTRPGVQPPGAKHAAPAGKRDMHGPPYILQPPLVARALARPLTAPQRYCNTLEGPLTRLVPYPVENPAGSNTKIGFPHRAQQCTRHQGPSQSSRRHCRQQRAHATSGFGRSERARDCTPGRLHARQTRRIARPGSRSRCRQRAWHGAPHCGVSPCER